MIAQGSKTLSTPAVYAAFDRVRSEKTIRNPTKAAVIDALEHGGKSELYAILHNDLELPAITLCPEIASVKDALLQTGATAAQMTGSGSAVFGLFDRESAARDSAAAMNQNGIKAVFCTLL